MAAAQMEDIMKKFDFISNKPVKRLPAYTEDIKHMVKSLYDHTKSQETSGKKEKKIALPELIVQDFDEEQIWQEIELQNSECWDKFVWEVASSISMKDKLFFPVEISSMSEDEVQGDSENLSSDNEDVHSQSVKSEDEEPDKDICKQKKIKTSIVDDKFFKLQEMEKFLIDEEKKDSGKGKPHSDSDEESIDMFEDVDDDDVEDEEGGVMYKDFFNQGPDDIQIEKSEIDMLKQRGNSESPDENDEASDEEDMSMEDLGPNYENFSDKKDGKDTKKVRFAMTSSDDSDNDEVINEKDVNGNTKDGPMSQFELRQQRLKEKIAKLEESRLKEAPWQLKGEVDAKKRPQNSLLQEVLDFDLTTRPVPVITEQTTFSLEDIIKRRIKDKAWDDVVRKEKPVDDQLSFRKEVILDQSKSKQSLAQIYEAEYLKQKQALSGEIEEEQEPEAHKEIRDNLSKLFAKLDALSHYHYTPKAPQAEVKIVTNTPAISMEEVAPVATSEAALLAPEEVKKKQRGDLMSKEERTDTDKKRERRKKKKLQQKKGTVKKVTDVRNTTKGVEASDQSLKTSKAFFQQLNDDSTSLIKKNKINVKNKGQ